MIRKNHLDIVQNRQGEAERTSGAQLFTHTPPPFYSAASFVKTDCFQSGTPLQLIRFVCHFQMLDAIRRFLYCCPRYEQLFISYDDTIKDDTGTKEIRGKCNNNMKKCAVLLL